MPLKNKYLKYSPEITLEIFTLVWNKLIQCGWRESVYAGGIEYRFMEFKGGEHLYNDKNGAKSFYVNYRNIQEFMRRSGLVLTETTVQEILGYDPFVKEDFVLPKKWCIKIQANGIPCEVAQWRKSSWSSSGYISSSGIWNCDNAIGYSEITLEQFKKYVLKDHIKEPKEVIPEYVECIKSVHGNKHPYIGQIIKADEEGYLPGICSYKSQTYNECFKPSTKEAFDAQNKPKQPLKQAVHCKTQEEWDFVQEKIGYKFTTKFSSNFDTISLDDKCSGTKKSWYEEMKWNALSFQEWCDLNEYKMKKEMILDESHIGKLVSLTYSGRFYDEVLVIKENGQIYLLNNIKPNNDGHSDKSVYKYSLLFPSIEDANKYCSNIKLLEKTNIIESDLKSLLEIKEQPVVKSNQEFKVGDYIFVMIKGKNFGDILKVTDSFIEKKSNYSGVWINHKPGSFGGGGFRLNGNGYIYGKDVRHATPEEINNYLISIGQIPTGEPLNTGIEPNKDGTFNYKSTLPGSSWTGLTPTNHLGAMYHGDIMGVYLAKNDKPKEEPIKFKYFSED